MSLLINDVSARASYVATAGQTVFALSFACFAATDLLVYKNAALLTLTTDYTVQNAGLNAGLQVTLVAGAALNDAILVVRAVPYSKTTELPLTGPLQVASLNTFLAKLLAMIQQVRDQLGRSPVLGLADTDGSGAYDAKSNRVQNLGAPINSADAVTKAYADARANVAGNVTPPLVGEIGKWLRATATGVYTWSTLLASHITDATAAGRALLTGADATAQRTSLGLGTLSTLSSLALSNIARTGSVGQVLASGGAGADASYVDGMTKLATISASTVSVVDIALPAGFSSYALIVSRAVPATADQALACRFSYDGGTTYASSLVYAYGFTFGQSNATGSGSGGTGTSIQLGGGTNSIGGIPSQYSFCITPGGPGQISAINGTCLTHSSGGVSLAGLFGGWSNLAGTAATNIRLFFPTGNITSIIGNLYGIK